MIDFNNTEVAFQHKSNPELKRAHLLFSAIGYNWLVNAGPGMLKVAFALRLPVIGIIRATVFRQFCGGENIQDCEKTMQVLKGRNVGTILDFSVEGEEHESTFDNTRDEIMATIRKAKGNPSIPFSVFKTTGLISLKTLEAVSSGKPLSETVQVAWERGKKRVEDICALAASENVRLFIDAEESWIQPAIDELAESAMHRWNASKAIIFNTVQLYRHDRLEYLKVIYSRCQENKVWMGVKLVRGAYMEKERERALEMGYPSPIQPDKESSDRDYNLAMEFCVENLHRTVVCAGTHNEESSEMLMKFMQEKGIDKSDERIWFSQLLGMSDHISFNLAGAGYNVVKYVPYGPVKAVVPYLIRRAQENTSAKGQAGRELRLIRQELYRRKKIGMM